MDSPACGTAYPAAYRTEPVSFTRRGGRLTARQQRAWEALADTHLVDLPRTNASTSVDPDFVLDPTAVFGRDAPLIVEIGSGRGDAIVAAAAERPDVNYLALEVYRPGIAQTFVTMRHAGVSNVRVALVNASEALETMFVPASVEELWVFFPDPWHKARHHKRRLVTASFARRAARVLVSGGIWRLSTDWQNYADQMREVLIDSEEFSFDGNWSPRYGGRPVTRFERKGSEVGRTIRDLCAVRVNSPTMDS